MYLCVFSKTILYTQKNNRNSNTSLTAVCGSLWLSVLVSRAGIARLFHTIHKLSSALLYRAPRNNQLANSQFVDEPTKELVAQKYEEKIIAHN